MDAPLVDRGSKATCFTEFLLADSTRDLIAAVLARPDAGAEAVQLALITCWHSLSDALEQQEGPSPEPAGPRHGHDEHCVEEHLMVALSYIDHVHWARTLGRRS